MRYMLVVKSTNDYEAGVWPDEKMQAELNKWTEELTKAGARLESGRLQPSSQPTRTRRRASCRTRNSSARWARSWRKG